MRRGGWCGVPRVISAWAASRSGWATPRPASGSACAWTRRLMAGPGRFRSAWPQGPAGDRARHAWRERLGKAGARWLAGQFAPPGAAAPADLAPRPISGHGRLLGWSFFDERDWDSRRAALSPARIGAACVTWVPGGA